MDKKALAMQKIYWNAQHANYERHEIKTDSWLDAFELTRSNLPIIDLGCGSGNNIPRLLETGRPVIPCDYSDLAIKNIRKNFPEIKRFECFDMTEGLPFPDNFTDLIIADLSLHYFSEKVTFQILAEIKRVLKADGTLLFRLNSMNDANYGAGIGEEVEKHYYFTGESSYKRFFDEEDIRHFWKDWNLEYLEERSLYRYDMPKSVWHGMARKKNVEL